MFIQKRKITASEEVVEPMGDAVVAPEATDLLFEAEDVAELVAEVTGEAVEVTADEESGAVTFAVGEDEYTVEAEGDEEVLESSTKIVGRRPVSASTKTRRTVSASTKRPARRVIKK